MAKHAYLLLTMFELFKLQRIHEDNDATGNVS